MVLFGIAMLPIPDVEISALRSFTMWCNLFAIWHQHLWFNTWEVWGDRVDV